MLKSGKALEPLYQALKEEVYESKAIFVDETSVDMQMPGKGKTHQGYMWVTATPTTRVYRFKTSRNHEHAVEILEGQLCTQINVELTNILQDKNDLYGRLGFSRIRRKFVEAEGGNPCLRSWMLRKIRYLFLLEKVGWSRPEKERLRTRKRLERSSMRSSQK